MNGKKKYLVIALLLLLGFGAVSFAGGNEEELEPVGGNNSQVEDKKGNETPNRVDEEVVSDENAQDDNLATDTTTPNTTTPNSNTSSNTTTTPENQVDLALLVTNTEKMIYDAVTKENVNDAKD